MILIVSICKEPLHDLEFVKPIEDISKFNNSKFKTIHYTKIKNPKKCDKVIICGTSLRDNDFLNHLDKFKWLKSFKKPVLGICGGSHIIGLILGYKIKNKKEVGFKEINLKKEFLGIKGKLKVYNLHNKAVLPDTFKKNNFYAVLFHPEVRNKEMVTNFTKLNR